MAKGDAVHLQMAKFPGWILQPARRVLDRYRKRLRVRVCVHEAEFNEGFGASRLSTLANPGTSVPVTGNPGWGLAGEAGRYVFLQVVNKSLTRDIELSHASFAGASDALLMTLFPPMPTRLRPEAKWEGWVNANWLSNVADVGHAGRAVITGREKPFKSRPCKHVPDTGYVAAPPQTGP
jgi:hypothetical protein